MENYRQMCEGGFVRIKNEIIEEPKPKKKKRNLHKQKEYFKKYYEKNQNIILEKKAKYRDENRQKINENASRKISCTCGEVVRKDGMKKHQKTTKHKKIVSLVNQIKEKYNQEKLV